MNDLEKLKIFLESVTYKDVKSDCPGNQKGEAPFVTISRQAGAGGNSLAAAILEELDVLDIPMAKGWQKFNQELCHKIAAEPGMNVYLERLVNLECRPEIEDMVSEVLAGTAPQDSVNKKLFEWIRALAIKGKAILIGRGSVCLTRDLPLGVHVRLVAPVEMRIKRISELLGLGEKKAKDFVAEQDQSRTRLMKTYFGKQIDDALLYDAVWNTGTVPMGQIARAVAMMVEKKINSRSQRELLH